MRTRLVALALAMLAAALPARPQQAPGLEQGFAANKVYDFGGIDSINTFNRNLILQIPIGPSYQVNGGLSYGLTLMYNSKVWGYESFGTEIIAFPNRRSNAGMGWLLSLGRLVSPETSSSGSVLYQSGDGNEHGFFPKLHDDDPATPTPLPVGVTSVQYTRDSSYLRMLTRSQSIDVEFPDGSSRSFAPGTRKLTGIRDRFGNSASITYLTSPAGTPCEVQNFAESWMIESWMITDSAPLGEPRRNYVCFKTMAYPDSEYPGKIDKIVLVAPPDENGVHRTATYTFQYAQTTVQRGCFSFSSLTSVSVPLLTGLVLPDGSIYTFTYNASTGVNCEMGTLKSVRLPTGAKIDYTYETYPVPPPPPPVTTCSPAMEWTTILVGVRGRTISGPGLTTATSTYRSDLSVNDVLVSCDGSPAMQGAPPEEMKVTVTDPIGDVVERFYSVWPGVHNSPLTWPFDPYEYGLPLTRTPNTSRGGRFLSSHTYTAAGFSQNPKVPLRSSYVNYARDAGCGLQNNCAQTNQRVIGERTVHHDDADRFVDTSYADFDGLGHFRRVTLTGSAGGNTETYAAFNERDAAVNPAPGTGTDKFIVSGSYPGASFRLPTLDHAWVLDTAPRVTVTEVTSSATTSSVTTHRCYDPLNGFLRAQRVLKATTRGTADLLTIFTPERGVLGDPLALTGNVASESHFGGDSLSQSLSTTAPLCDLATTSPNGPEYKINHTHQAGVRNTSKYEGTSFFALDLTIDPGSGLATESRDTAGLSTKYIHDLLGRLQEVRPAGRARARYTYNLLSQPPSVTIQRINPATPTALTDQRIYYDGLGRVIQVRDEMPGGWSTTNTTYDLLGRKKSVSMPEFRTSSAYDLFTPPHKTTYDYDTLSRLTKVTTPDSAETFFQYVGGRQRKRTSFISMGVGQPDTAVMTTEEYDAQGRLVKVIEKSGPTGASTPSGAAVTTEYAYDAGSRLTSVIMAGAEGTTQRRTFDYDGRGFLRSETHPEVRSETHPEREVTSYTYGARGNVLTKRHGSANLLFDSLFDLDYTYDQAGRPLEIRGRNPHFDPADPDRPAFRMMRTFAYGTANGTADYRKGKLVNAARYNYDPAQEEGTTYKVAESYVYGDDAGRKTSRRTTITKGFGANESAWVLYKNIEMAIAYDELDLPVETTYPMCWDCGAPSGGPWRDQRTTYDRGRLVTVGGFVSGTTYSANGMWKTMSRTNGMTDMQSVHSSGMPRPGEISSGPSTSCNPAAITVQPEGGSITPATPSVTLAVSVTGTGPFTYQWRSNKSSSPVGTGATFVASATSTPTTTLYWVIVANACRTVESVAATVSVGECIPPGGSVESVALGNGEYRLSVTGSGTEPRTYTWRRSPDPAIIGINRTVTVRPVSATTTYTVTIDNDCPAPPVTLEVTITIPQPVTGLTATKTGTTQITVTWAGSAPANKLERRSGAAGWKQIAQVTGTNYVDNHLQQGLTYAYRVTAGDLISHADVATTATFPPAVVGATVTSASFDAALTAVNSVRAAFGWPPLTWSSALSTPGPVPAPSVLISAHHLNTCRARMNEALQSLGVTPVPWFIDPDPAMRTIKAAQINEIIGRAY